MGRTRQHVDQVMVIGNANTDVQRMVASGEVAATTAVKAVRQHGEKAGKVLGDKLKQVQAAGGSKVTPKAINGPQVPRGVLDDMHKLCKSIAESFPPQVRAAIGEGAEVITLTMKASQVERLVDLVRAADEALLAD
ncbi:hypothetical protein [Pseudomonas sp. DP-17]|uniref:hypothetical protein n=1 Tax=Pseudomonas sp. DP-17 TaxID=1580486 RepID=UPI001EFB4470|nr:hypothetical protein [Pseudomonas sp. DP-17]MCG8911270.1 hypothetical protein [Pseudomonas sp. DP-17]